LESLLAASGAGIAFYGERFVPSRLNGGFDPLAPMLSAQYRGYAID